MPFRSFLSILVLVLASTVAAQTIQTAPTQEQTDSPLIRAQSNAVLVDVVVTGRYGKPVATLRKEDFALTEDGKQQAIDFFEEHTGTVQEAVSEPALPPHVFSNQATFTGADAATILLIDRLNTTAGDQGAIDRFNRSLKQVRFIAENESHKRGRKLLVWVGPGWPMLESEHFVPGPNDQRNYFEAIVDLTNWLRQAQMTIYSVSAFDSAANVDRSFFYQNFTKPITEPRLAESGNLALRVLAVPSGGLALGPDNDLGRQIQQCVADADGYYQLTFEAPPAQHADEYHALKVSVSQPGATARTTAGYYNEPAHGEDTAVGRMASCGSGFRLATHWLPLRP